IGGLEVYDPGGVPMSELRLCRFGRVMCALGASRGIEAVSGLIANPDFLAHASRMTGESKEVILKRFDEYRLRRLPGGLPGPDSPGVPPVVAAVFDEIDRLLSLVESGDLRGLFTAVFGGDDYPAVRGVPFADELIEMRDVLGVFEQSEILTDVKGANRLELLCGELGGRRLYGVHAARALGVEGFLELPFLEQPEVVICGMNSGFVPESVESGSFLTDSTRSALGLACDSKRRARDAFLLAGAEVAVPGPRLYYIGARFGATGTPLRFSVFLFNCDDRQLIERVELMFADSPAAETDDGAAGECFALRPDFGHVAHRDDAPVLSVTDFKVLLANPLDYFFSRVMKMEEIDYSQCELDAPGFGTICHRAFELLDETDFMRETAVAAGLHTALERAFAETFGRPLPPMLELQRDQIEQRMNAAAVTLSAELRQFRRIEREYKLGGGDGIPFAGAVIKGKIDRIELSHDGRILRLIDFKTSDQASKPDAAHLGGRPGAKHFNDLQLPLYRLLIVRDKAFLAAHPEIDFATVEIQCAYFVLPKNVSDTAVLVWDGLENMLELAEDTAIKVVKTVKRLMKGELPRGGSSTFARLMMPEQETALRGVVWYDK
ncbi:MAG: PD-(D/E)XK nuclease family protein, partial [Victivallaceae bacterium]|nr:PD-(D/E)XK nuclease family protein [Victivallaceae bacterium]